MNFSNLGWAGLPKHILDSILDCVIQFSDYIHFCSVCTSWRSVALEENNYHHVQKQKLCILQACHGRLPMLMIPPTLHNKEKQIFYSVTDGIIHDLQLPMPYNRRCFGSSHGWLFTIQKSMIISLLNPFKWRTIHLPEFKDPENVYELWVRQDDFEYFLYKGILSSDPSQDANSYEAVVLYEGLRRLASFKSGDATWRFFNLKKDYVFSDIIYYKGQLHAINRYGGLVRIDVTRGDGKVIIKPRQTMYAETTYLVTSCNRDLLMIQRFRKENEHDNEHWKTFDFKIFKMVHLTKTRKKSWVEINNIGDQALFLGDNYSLAFSVSNFSECSPNCIYYIDHDFPITCHYVPHGHDDDTGVFNLMDKSFGSHYIADPENLVPLIWIVPNFRDDIQPI